MSSDDRRLLDETAAALQEIGDLRAKVELALLEVRLGTLQYDSLAGWRARLEEFYFSLVLACSSWRLGTARASHLQWCLERWREDPTRGAL